MPKYKVVKSYSAANPVGSYIHSDDLHPFLEQHVMMVDERPVAEILAEPDAAPVLDKAPKRPQRNAPAKVQKDEQVFTDEQMASLELEAAAFDQALFPKE